MNKPEITAVIVARKGSTRIPNKNMMTLGSDTLISRKIKQLKSCDKIDRVIFGSDCEYMLEYARQFGAETVRRPDFYCDEKQATANDMIFNMCSLINTDIVLWAHCTNPLISSCTYDNAIQIFLENEKSKKYDSLLSVVEFKEHLWSTDKKPLNYNPYQSKHIPARELPAYYMQDGSIFIQPHKQMLENRYFFGIKPYLFTIPEEEFLDINNMRDYLLAKTIVELDYYKI